MFFILLQEITVFLSETAYSIPVFKTKDEPLLAVLKPTDELYKLSLLINGLTVEFCNFIGPFEEIFDLIYDDGITEGLDITSFVCLRKLILSLLIENDGIF